MSMPPARDPVFRTVGQALHVAFLMEVLPPTQKGPTQLFIEDLMRRHFCLDELSRNERSLNSTGLTPLELRGQCAMVRACVQDHLTQPERVAIWARFGQQRTRAEGVRGLSTYLRALCKLQNGDALLALTWALYAPKLLPKDKKTGRRLDWSLRDISDRYGVPRSTLADTRKVIHHHAEHLERAAEARLAELFDRTGLVGEFADDEAMTA